MADVHHPIVLGRLEDGKPLRIRLDKMEHLIAAGSTGAGKSNLFRLLLERTAGVVQQVIIDPEDEYATLREIHPYVIVGGSGADYPLPVDQDVIAAFARHVLEKRLDIIVQLNEEDMIDGKKFVATFLRTLRKAPRDLWSPILLVPDESHRFAPEQGKGQKGKDADACKTEVCETASAGRKRLQKLVLGSTRLAKIAKDATGECNSRLIGRCNDPGDRKRACEELGISGTDRKAREEMMDRIRRLRPGQFLAVGDAFGLDDVTAVQVDLARTKPPAVGKAALRVPPPQREVRAALEGLLLVAPKAKQEARDLEGLKAQVRELQKRLKAAETRGPAAATPHLADEEKALRARLVALERRAAAQDREWQRWAARARRALEGAQQALGGAGEVLERHPTVEATVDAPAAPRATGRLPPRVAVTPGNGTAPSIESAEGVSSSQQRILDALAELADVGFEAPGKDMLAGYVAVPPSSGGYRNNLSALRTRGLLDYPSPGVVSLTDAGRAVARARPAPVTAEDVQARVREVLSSSQAEILDSLLQAYPEAVAKIELAAAVGVPASSGGYRNNLSRLRTLGLIDYPAAGTARARPWILLEVEHGA